MRKFAFTLAAGAAALGFAAPASAQYMPYGYGYAPRAYGDGYNTAAVAQGMDARVASIRAQVRDMNYRGMISRSRARTLDREALQIQRSIRATAWNGISPGEQYSLDRRIARLQQRVQYASYNRIRPRYVGYRYF